MKIFQIILTCFIISIFIGGLVFVNEGQKNKIIKYYYGNPSEWTEVDRSFYNKSTIPPENKKKMKLFNYESAMIKGIKAFGYSGLT